MLQILDILWKNTKKFGVVINETELRHEMRSKDLPIKSLMIKLSKV